MKFREWDESKLKEAADEKIQWEASGKRKKMNYLMEEMKRKLRTNCRRCTFRDVTIEIATTLYLTILTFIRSENSLVVLYEKYDVILRLSIFIVIYKTFHFFLLMLVYVCLMRICMNKVIRFILSIDLLNSFIDIFSSVIF